MAGASHACFAPWLGGQPGASGDAPGIYSATTLKPPKKWPGLIKGIIKEIMVVHKSLLRPVISLGGVKGRHWGGNYP